eukprot:10899624-Alexandrium_andersonii.AAC.1
MSMGVKGAALRVASPAPWTVRQNQWELVELEHRTLQVAVNDARVMFRWRSGSTRCCVKLRMRTLKGSKEFCVETEGG